MKRTSSLTAEFVALATPSKAGILCSIDSAGVRVLRVLLFDLISDAVIVLDVHEVVHITH
jgi:hypothetical protein